MEYRRFGGLDWDISVLGFGCIRFPNESGNENIAETEAARCFVVRLTMAWTTPTPLIRMTITVDSEPFARCVLRDKHREKVRLATKVPT
jgi:predicted aldo/keto reductase-like oxidoreductase